MDNEKLVEIVSQAVAQVLSGQSDIGRTGTYHKNALLILDGEGNSFCGSKLIENLASVYNLAILPVTCPSEAGRFEKYGEVLDSLPALKQEWMGRFDAVIISDITITSVSKIAHVILDGIVPEIVYVALMAHKKVLADILPLKEQIERLPSALKDEMLGMINKIKRFGVNELDLAGISQKLPSENVLERKAVGNMRFFTLDDVKANVGKDGVLLMDARDKLTPLAWDYVKENSIVIK